MLMVGSLTRSSALYGMTVIIVVRDTFWNSVSDLCTLHNQKQAINTCVTHCLRQRDLKFNCRIFFRRFTFSRNCTSNIRCLFFYGLHLSTYFRINLSKSKSFLEEMTRTEFTAIIRSTKAPPVSGCQVNSCRARNLPARQSVKLQGNKHITY